jgi:hypothetical protein
MIDEHIASALILDLLACLGAGGWLGRGRARLSADVTLPLPGDRYQGAPDHHRGEGAAMHHARTAAVAIATAVLSLGASPVAAHSDKPGDEPCAKQRQQQVDKAHDALDHVTAVFEHQKTKVERLQERLDAATTQQEKDRIQAQLDKALAKEQHTRKAKKAQQQRLSKSEQRLADCQAEQTA